MSPTINNKKYIGLMKYYTDVNFKASFTKDKRM